MPYFTINRRTFLQGASASLVLTTLGASGLDQSHDQAKTYRVGLIGTGWYGKSDLLRLIQVSPVDVVALCDVDKNQLDGAAKLVAQRQKSGKTPKLYGDYRRMLVTELTRRLAVMVHILEREGPLAIDVAITLLVGEQCLGQGIGIIKPRPV